MLSPPMRLASRRISTSTEIGNFVGGKRVQPTAPSHSFPVLNPATGAVYASAGSSSAADVAEAVGVAKAAQPEWAARSGFERGKVLRAAADLIRADLEAIARLEVLDNGKPIWEARMDVGGCADVFEYYAGIATTANQGEHIPLPGGRSFAITRREPLGVVGGIGAWNYPFQTASWKLSPALACGNAFVYKPSPLTPLTALVLAEILTAAGAPPGIVGVVQGEKETGEALCLSPDVGKISFTGSLGTGRAIMANCAARGLKPVTLELGGKSPLLVFDDADVGRAVEGALMANFYTQGEVCSNAAKVYVHSSLMPQIEEQLVKRVKAMKIGDPLDEETKVGATISEDHMNKVLTYIQSAKDEGATVLCGGERVLTESGGFFLSPCILKDVREDMKVAEEEIFGSVLLLLPFEEEAAVVAAANATEFGLAAGLFTRDLQRAHRVAAQLQAGSVWVNTYNVTPVEVPFGGYKSSGFGRECGTAAFANYTQLKSITFDMDPVLDSGL